MAARPNVVVILSDQLRRHALGCYGDPNVATPHTDRLAAEGVAFDTACSTYPICVPFRFTLMTGEYAHSRMIPGIEWRMSPAERTLADELNEGGYETVYVGKWHLHGGHLHLPGYSAVQVNRTAVPPLYQGRWRHWYGFELRNGPHDTCYYRGADPTPIPIEGYQTDGLFDLAMDHLRDRQSDQPFFTVISVEPPHPPYEAPADKEAEWRDREIELPPNFKLPDDPAVAERLMAEFRIYYAMVENLDDNVGRLRAFLAEQGLADDTIVVYLSDHGEMLGSHGKRNKQWPDEESVGIPLIVSDPHDRGRWGSRVATPVSTEDLFPTLLGLCGLSPRNDLPGTDATPLIRGEAQGLNRPGVLLEFVSETRAGRLFSDWTWRGFRSERYKYTVKGDYNGSAPWQFFDLQEDPYELHNLVDDPAARDLVVQHHQWLRDEMVRTHDDFVLSESFGIPGLNLWMEHA